MQSIAEVEAICYQNELDRAEAHMNEQDREPTALELYESCAHACACCRQYERAHGTIADTHWQEWLPDAMGCAGCDEHEE